MQECEKCKRWFEGQLYFGWCRDCAKAEKDAKETNTVLVSKELLLEIKQGIYDAIYDENGLDGAEGTYLLSGVNQALGLDATDNNPP